MERGGESDAQLWPHAAAGDGDAFGLLFDRHRDRVFRHVCRLVDTRQDAEDVVAVTFLELWRRRRDVRLVNGSVLAWLLVTATNGGRNTTRGVRRFVLGLTPSAVKSRLHRIRQRMREQLGSDPHDHATNLGVQQ